MKHKGFTVLEILVAISIIALAVTIITISLSKLNSSQVLDKSATLVTSILDEARSLTLSSKDDSQYGVYLEDSQVVLFKGATYSQSNPTNVVTSLHSLVGLRSIILSGGGTSVVFKRLTGNTDQAGTAEVFLKSSPTTFHTITVSATGIVELD
ncbi:MAG: prepilin-type N-terminal cleavage/methylation domain-containing protein [bacterium]|nr:prepilin-type N-terminal cleavage/methylation domain-containing protein [bacterium]MDZ4205729.1 prepilin-type N-terminal cleavage/methylation domain-containing protein [Patescibacteria group bacterium]